MIMIMQQLFTIFSHFMDYKPTSKEVGTLKFE